MGGHGSILGFALAALTLGLISNGLVLHGPVNWVLIVPALILVAILLNRRHLERIVGAQR